MMGRIRFFMTTFSFMPEKDAYLPRQTQATRPEGYGPVNFVNL
jgi:hypothetical protein